MLFSACIAERQVKALLCCAEVLDFLPVYVTHKRCFHIVALFNIISVLTNIIVADICSSMIDLAASITSSTISTSLLYPIERFKIQMQLNKEDSSFTSSFRSILEQQGIIGFYQGLSPLVVGNALAYGIYFVAYQKLKVLFKADSGSMIRILESSGLAGAISCVFTNPFYVLQTRQSKQNKNMVVLGA